jgi:hypothetical protein
MEKVAEELGQLNFESSDWIEVDNGFQRNLKYSLSRQQSPFATAVSVVQKKTRDPREKPSWAEVEEAIVLHNVPFGDHFQASALHSL